MKVTGYGLKTCDRRPATRVYAPKMGSRSGFDIEVPFAFEPSPFAKLFNARTNHHRLQAFAH